MSPLWPPFWWDNPNKARVKRGLLSYWPLDEASGTRHDAWGVNPLTDNASVGQAAGKVSAAAQITAASSNFLSCTGTGTLALGDIDLTLACWAYFDALGANRDLLGQWDASVANQRGHLLFFRVTGATIRWMVSSDGVAISATVDAPIVVATGTWYYVVVWRDRAAQTINIQVNNGAVASAAYSSAIFASTTQFRIGRRTDGAGQMDGRVDEAARWSRVLPAAERAYLYNSGSGRRVA